MNLVQLSNRDVYKKNTFTCRFNKSPSNMGGSGLDPPNFLTYKNSTTIYIENFNIDKIFSNSRQNI